EALDVRGRGPDLPVLGVTKDDRLLVPLDEQAGRDQPGAGLEAVHGVLRIHRARRLEDLLEQLGPGGLGPDLAQVRAERDADSLEAGAAPAVGDPPRRAS